MDPVTDVEFAFVINRKERLLVPARWPSGARRWLRARLARQLLLECAYLPRARQKGVRQCAQNKIAQHDEFRRSNHDVPQCSEVDHDEETAYNIFALAVGALIPIALVIVMLIL